MLEIVSWFFLFLGLLTGLAIVIDVFRHPQPMGIMNVTWPVTGLYIPVAGWWVYKSMGRPDALLAERHAAHRHDDDHGGHHHHHSDKPRWQSVFVSVTHCGGGCALGDALAAPIVSALGVTLAGSVLLAHFAGEFVAAYLFGILFQLLPIMSMGERNPFKALADAVKADTLSLIAFEIGMFGWIAIAFLLLLPSEPEVSSPVYWFMMQIAMLIGFATAYPANWYLVKAGIKHGM